MNPMLDDIIRKYDEAKELRNEVRRLHTVNMELSRELREYKRKETLIASERVRKAQGVKEKTTDEEDHDLDVVVLESSSHTSDSLILSKYKANDVVHATSKGVKQTSKPSCIGVVREIGCSTTRKTWSL